MYHMTKYNAPDPDALSAEMHHQLKAAATRIVI